MIAASLLVAWGAVVAAPEIEGPILVRVPLNESSEIDVGDAVAGLASATGSSVARPPGKITLPITGLAGKLTRQMLSDTLGPDASLALLDDALVITLDARLREPGRSPEWQQRLVRLAAQVEREAKRRQRYGMHALPSYRPNDPRRPTVCLVHGMNSSSGGFVHMIPPLEEAGYGVVVYDYPFNRDLDESCQAFRRDWRAFRREVGETRPWALLAHSMGALLAWSYVEDPQNDARDVSSLILIGPVIRGSSLAKVQTLLQLLDGVQAVNGKKADDALAHLGDGLGEAATDITPGSTFLEALNRRPRREGVPYHILAGDVGFLSPAVRRQVEAQVAVFRREPGMLGGLVRLATADLASRLDEISTGTGDGCVSVARTRLDGVADHVTIHVNHAALIRAPLLFPDPGPVACMPFVLRWIAADAAPRGGWDPTDISVIWSGGGTFVGPFPGFRDRSPATVRPCLDDREPSMTTPIAEFDETVDAAKSGHPRGLYVLFGTEMWERFSYYGMRALLVLYLTKHLKFSRAEALDVYATYTGLVYLTPLLGGYLADKYLGQRKAILIGGSLMALGHFAMAFEPLLNLALGLLILGNGFFKPNISTMVGQLYPQGDARRDSAYTIFYMGINLGAFFSPLVCGTLGEQIGWHFGFGAAGVGMVFGLIMFAAFQGWLGTGGYPAGRADRGELRLMAADWVHVALLTLVGVGVVSLAFTPAGAILRRVPGYGHLPVLLVLDRTGVRPDRDHPRGDCAARGRRPSTRRRGVTTPRRRHMCLSRMRRSGKTRTRRSPGRNGKGSSPS